VFFPLFAPRLGGSETISIALMQEKSHGICFGENKMLFSVGGGNNGGIVTPLNAGAS